MAPRAKKVELDRFIPFRSASNLHLAMANLKPKSDATPSELDYQKRLKNALGICLNPRILGFMSKPAVAPTLEFDDYASIRPSLLKPHSHRHILEASQRVWDAPDIVDGPYLSLIDWGTNNVIAIALGNSVYLRNVTSKETTELLTVEDGTGPVTSVSWAPDGRHIVIGFYNCQLELWDSTTNQKVRDLNLQGDTHEGFVRSMAWHNQHVLTSGSSKGSIINSDTRIDSHIVDTYRGHRGQICGLKWSPSGQRLATGGSDSLVYIWDRRLASSRTNGSKQWLLRLDNHRDTVGALAWCPFQSNMLASGGGASDGCIKFWSTVTGSCLNSVDTCSQVSSLVWSKNDRELLSSHGSPYNKLRVWRYPSMVTMAELYGHESGILCTTQSPDGSIVVSASGDETLKFWEVFKPLQVRRPSQGKGVVPFAYASRCSIR